MSNGEGFAPEEIRGHLEQAAGLLPGKFPENSGSLIPQCDAVLAWPSRVAILGSALGMRWSDAPIDLVVGLGAGGTLLAHETARYLGVPSIQVDLSPSGELRWRDGFRVETRARILVVWPQIEETGAAEALVRGLADAGARVVGIGSVVASGSVGSLAGVPHHSLYGRSAERGAAAAPDS